MAEAPPSWSRCPTDGGGSKAVAASADTATPEDQPTEAVAAVETEAAPDQPAEGTAVDTDATLNVAANADDDDAEGGDGDNDDSSLLLRLGGGRRRRSSD